MSNSNPGPGATTGQLAAAVRGSDALVALRQRLLVDAVLDEPGTDQFSDWRDALGALPAHRQASLRDRIAADVDELIEQAARTSVAAHDALGLTATSTGVPALVVVALWRRRLADDDVPTIDGGSRHEPS